MTEIARIQDQLVRAFEGNAWHGPSLKELLTDLTAPQAAARPLATGHSIWEIVLHLVAWEGIVRRRIEGSEIAVTPDEDWPAVADISEAAWMSTRQVLEDAHLTLYESIGRLDDSQLDNLIAGSKSTIYVTLHGVIQHNLYHGGQIALLKKAVL